MEVSILMSHGTVWCGRSPEGYRKLVAQNKTVPFFLTEVTKNLAPFFNLNDVALKKINGNVFNTVFVCSPLPSSQSHTFNLSFCKFSS